MMAWAVVGSVSVAVNGQIAARRVNWRVTRNGAALASIRRCGLVVGGR